MTKRFSGVHAVDALSFSVERLPLLPVGLAFFTLVNPDSALIRLLGIFPLTSDAVLPARMVMTEVAWWEIALALPLLMATIWLFRRARRRQDLFRRHDDVRQGAQPHRDVAMVLEELTGNRNRPTIGSDRITPEPSAPSGKAQR